MKILQISINAFHHTYILLFLHTKKYIFNTFRGLVQNIISKVILIIESLQINVSNNELQLNK